MAGLMVRPVLEESSTADETVFLGAGYSYWLGHRYYLNCEHPPLMQLWSALPLLCQNIETPPHTAFYFDCQHPLTETRTWDGRTVSFDSIFRDGIDSYYYPFAESRRFGDWLVYGGKNDATRVLFSGRLMQILITLTVGLVVFGWARSLAGNVGGLLALITWGFNPVALAFGHLVGTDPGITLFLVLTVWMWSRFLENPNGRHAVFAGLALAAALLTKFSAIVLLPTIILLWAIAWWQHRKDTQHQSWLKKSMVGMVVCVVVAWALVWLVYFPMWAPPPAIDVARAELLGVPHWWRFCHWALIPREYFKGLGIVFAHSKAGHPAYLLGSWSVLGWWYYFPAALFFKTPLALLLLIGLAFILAGKQVRGSTLAKLAPAVAVVVYLAIAMTSHINIGIRHVLPVYALFAVMIGVWCGSAGARIRLVACGFAGALVIVALLAQPYYLEYFNEYCGGAADGYKYLVDSNLDWGQDALRLKQFVDRHRIDHVYLDATYSAITGKYYKMNQTTVDGASARSLTNAWLVVSGSRLVQPEWNWLRERYSPSATLANSTFIYQIP